MNLTKLLQGLDMIREVIVAELDKDAVTSVADAKVVNMEDAKATKKATKKAETKEELIPQSVKDEVKATLPKEEVVDTDVEVEDLTSLSYNDLKKKAKELGLSAKGSKGDIIARIEDHLGVPVQEDEEDEVEDTQEVEETDNIDVEGEEVEEEPTPHDEVVEMLAEYTNDELKEILEGVELSTKGKREALIARIVQAIEDGVLSFEDEDEDLEDTEEETVEEEVVATDEVEEEDEDDTEEESDEEEEGIDIEDILEPLDRDEVKAICRKLEIKVMKKDTADSLREKVMAYEDDQSLVDVLIDLGHVSFDEEDEEDVEDEEVSLEPNYVGSKKRIKTMKKVYKDTLEEIENGDITKKQVVKFLKDVHNGTWEGTENESALEYARLKAECVDLDGDIIDLEEAYYIDDETIFCCGKELSVVDDGMYCEHCGSEYGDEE